MMKSVLQEIRGLTKELYTPRGSPVSMQISGPLFIIFSRTKRLTKVCAYALDRMEIWLHAKFGAVVSEICVFKRR